MLLCVLLDENLRTTERAWLLPISLLRKISSERAKKHVIRANKQLGTNDKYKPYQCKSMVEVTNRLIEYFEK
jgi:hypothetical protein